MLGIIVDREAGTVGPFHRYRLCLERYGANGEENDPPTPAMIVPHRLDACLEFEAQCELQDPGIAGAGDLHKVAASHSGSRIGEVDVVKQVEGFEAKLEFHALPHREILVQAVVQIERPGTTVGIASQNTVSPESVYGERRAVQVLSGYGAVTVIGKIR